MDRKASAEMPVIAMVTASVEPSMPKVEAAQLSQTAFLKTISPQQVLEQQAARQVMGLQYLQMMVVLPLTAGMVLCFPPVTMAAMGLPAVLPILRTPQV
jgi:hypothetical protein